MNKLKVGLRFEAIGLGRIYVIKKVGWFYVNMYCETTGGMLRLRKSKAISIIARTL